MQIVQSPVLPGNCVIPFPSHFVFSGKSEQGNLLFILTDLYPNLHSGTQHVYTIFLRHITNC